MTQNYATCAELADRASDERGLIPVQRTQYNKELLHYMLDELMPWHVQAELHDFSLLEVNQ